MTRRVRLLLVDRHGEPLGLLPPVVAGTGWWPDVAPALEAVRDRWGLDVAVLRVLSELSRPDPDAPSVPVGGEVTYLAEVATAGVLPADLQAVDDATASAALADHPLRAPWARVGGPARIVAWADDVLAARGTPRTGPVEQVKTWNLSSILRLPTTSGPVWCKSVPTFFAHEAAIIERVARRRPALVPRVLAADAATSSLLLADVPGEDQWTARTPRLLEMVQATVDLQRETAEELDVLLGLGLPDWRGPALVAAVSALAAREDVRAALTVTDREALDDVVGRLPALVDELDAGGLPDTLVHGDLHPGNWRHGAGRLVLLDWGDSGVGHPLLDEPAFLERVDEPSRRLVREAWSAAWRRHVPLADPARAGAALAPLAALRQALIYQGFLDRIEPDERVYHRGDVPHWIRQARLAVR